MDRQFIKVLVYFSLQGIVGKLFFFQLSETAFIFDILLFAEGKYSTKKFSQGKSIVQKKNLDNIQSIFNLIYDKRFDRYVIYFKNTFMDQEAEGRKEQQKSLKRVEDRLSRIESILQDQMAPRIGQATHQIQKLNLRMDKAEKKDEEFNEQYYKDRNFLQNDMGNKIVDCLVEKLKESKESRKLEESIESLKEELQTTNKKLMEFQEKMSSSLQPTQQQKHINQSPIITSPFKENFDVEGNEIKLKDTWEEPQQIMLDMPIQTKLTLTVNVIETERGRIKVGILDMLARENSQFSYDSGHAICYDGFRGWLYNGKGDDGKSDVENLGDTFATGISVFMHVDMEACIVYFTLKGISYHMKIDDLIHGTRRYEAQSPILRDPGRRFVPFFEMMDKDDKISWKIQ